MMYFICDHFYSGQECVKQFWLLLWDNSMDKFCKEQAAQIPNK